jgi:two-component system cell cycle response regulator
VTEVFPKSDLKLLSHYIANVAEQKLDTGEVPGRILYVEDQKSTASFISELLRQNGFDVRHYFKAEDALDAFNNEDFDLVLTDVILEGEMSGLGLVRAINTDPDKHMTPILAMSGMSDPARKVELLRAGANDYVSKPVVEGELVARVTNMLVNKRLFDKVHEQQKRMQEMAMMDQLTGLFNRHYLGETAPKYLSKACRHQYELSLLVIDLDHFKAINDTYGHMAGDTVLKEVGGVLKDFGRREDIVARFGGEEFVIMLTHCGADDAYKRAEVLRKNIEALKPAGLTVTSSIGVATLGKDIELEQCGFEQLFAAADDAVYKAKGSGRNCVKVGQLKVS